MDRFLRGLVIDLTRRCHALRQLLERGVYHPDVQERIQELLAQLSRTQSDIETLFNDPAFGSPRLLPSQLRDYKVLARFIYLVESYPVPFIARYNDEDHFLYLLCKKLASQISYPLSLPTVSTSSKEYYWTEPVFNLISIPSLEGSFLLGLPDLCHEMGHITFFNYEERFSQEFLVHLENFVTNAKREIKRAKRPPRYLEFYDHMHTLWKDHWLKEFASGLIATYLVGPAYGWTNLSVCCKLSADIYTPEDSLTHPSDQSRTRGILAMLKSLGMIREAEEVRKKWDSYAQITGDVEPADYNLLYPNTLIDSLVSRVLEACRSLGLRGYTEQRTSANDINIPLLLNEAWQIFLQRPEGYGNWEDSRIQELRQNLL